MDDAEDHFEVMLSLAKPLSVHSWTNCSYLWSLYFSYDASWQTLLPLFSLV